MVRKLKTKNIKKEKPGMFSDVLAQMFGKEIQERNKKITEMNIVTKEYKELKELTIGNYEKGLTPTKEQIDYYVDNFNEIFKTFLLLEGIYYIPTKKVIEHLKDEIKDYKNVIEIGSGNGYLCKTLGITGTDSMCQLEPSIIRTYEEMGQKAIEYKNKDVLKFKDLEAIENLKPDCIVASWTTIKKTLNDNKSEGFYDGVEDDKYMSYDFVKKYIFIGHQEIHKSKDIVTIEGINDVLTPLMKKDLGFKVNFYTGDEICSRRYGEVNNMIVIIEKTNTYGIKITV